MVRAHSSRSATSSEDTGKGKSTTAKTRKIFNEKPRTRPVQLICLPNLFSRRRIAKKLESQSLEPAIGQRTADGRGAEKIERKIHTSAYSTRKKTYHHRSINGKTSPRPTGCSIDVIFSSSTKRVGKKKRHRHQNGGARHRKSNQETQLHATAVVGHPPCGWNRQTDAVAGRTKPRFQRTPEPGPVDSAGVGKRDSRRLSTAPMMVGTTEPESSSLGAGKAATVAWAEGEGENIVDQHGATELK